MRLMGHASVRHAEVYVRLAGRDVKDAHERYSPVARMLEMRGR
jgi:hypothetical protein